MSDKLKKNNIFIIVSIFIVVLGSISAMFYINLQKNKTVDVEATVKLVGNNYIIVEDSKGEEYSLKTNQEYNVGDKVAFVIKDIDENSYPKEGTVVKIDTVSKNINFSITDDVVEESDNSSVSENTTNQKDTSNDTVSSNTSSTEDDVIAYFENLNNKIATYNQDKSIGDSLKEGFVTVVDFLFYDGKIKGKTFDELSATAKLKVLKLVFSIDDRIDKYFPGYKEEISSTGQKVYTNVKAKATALYLDVTTSVCTNDPYTCESAKEGLSDLKESFSLTWDFIKEISGIGVSKLKAWYEVWKTV